MYVCMPSLHFQFHDFYSYFFPFVLQDDAEIIEDTTEDTAYTDALAAATGVFGSGARAASALSNRRR